MGNRTVQYDADEIRRLWEEGIPQHDICIATGLNTGTFWMIKKRLGLPRREADRVRSTAFTWGDDPSPDEIEARAAIEREKWTAEDWEKRGRWMRPAVETKVYST